MNVRCRKPAIAILPGRGGFTLVEVVVAVAIVAILAAAVTPLAFREMSRAREDATLDELASLRQGLLDFYEDTGRFPSEAEGLGALVADPGVSGWQGPYVGGGDGLPLAEATTDAWGGTYLYDLGPVTVPAGAADVVVASGGIDGLVTFGAVGGTWTIDGAGDDLLSVVAAGPVNRDKVPSRPIRPTSWTATSTPASTATRWRTPGVAPTRSWSMSRAPTRPTSSRAAGDRTGPTTAAGTTTSA
jgi:general secretion pathway protein G